MSRRDLARGYGKRIVYQKDEFLLVGRNWRALDDSEPEYFIYFDSDMNHYMEGVKTETRSLGRTITDYTTRKLTIKQFVDSEQDYDQDLLNAYDIPEIFTDKSQLYDIGPTLPLNFIVVILDSEGARTWKKIAEPGIDAGDYDIRPQLLRRITGLETAIAYSSVENQLNQNPFTFDKYIGSMVLVTARDFKVDSNGILTTPGFEGKESAVVVITKDGKYIETQGFTNLSADSELVYRDSENDIVYYYNIIARDSDRLGFILRDSDTPAGMKFRYIKQGADSEIIVQDSSFHKLTPINFPREFYLGDSESFDTSFTTWHEDAEPWNVFNDSDNDGFKASLGVQSGYISLVTDDDFYRYKLDRVIIQNNLSTIAFNRPADFRIEMYSLVTGSWRTIHTVRGFDGYTYNHAFSPDSDTYGHGFKVVFEGCQPGFDSDYNSLEVKKMIFETTRGERNVTKFGKGIFVTDPDSDYLFTLEDSEEFFGFVQGGGGGGGGGFVGKGGSGGASVDIPTLKLPPGTYSLRCGKGGQGAPARISDTSREYVPRAESGGGTIIYDVTNNKKIIEAEGGLGGFSGYVDSDGNSVYGSIGPEGFAKVFIDSDYLVSSDVELEYIKYQSFYGGASAHPGNPSGQYGPKRTRLPGFLGEYIYVDKFTHRYEEFGYGSGGDGGSSAGYNRLDPARAAAVGSGTPSTDPNIRNAADNRGAGGAGGMKIDGAWQPGGNGGSGYVYLIFKTK